MASRVAAAPLVRASPVPIHAGAVAREQVLAEQAARDEAAGVALLLEERVGARRGALGGVHRPERLIDVAAVRRPKVARLLAVVALAQRVDRDVLAAAGGVELREGLAARGLAPGAHAVQLGETGFHVPGHALAGDLGQAEACAPRGHAPGARPVGERVGLPQVLRHAASLRVGHAHVQAAERRPRLAPTKEEPRAEGLVLGHTAAGAGSRPQAGYHTIGTIPLSVMRPSFVTSFTPSTSAVATMRRSPGSPSRAPRS